MSQLNRHLASHHGIISRSEALALGLSERTIARRVGVGEWKQIHRGVYRLAGAPPSWLGQARAAVLASDGLLSHRAAARLWALDGFDRARPELTIDVDRRVRLGARVAVHRTTQLALADPRSRRGVAVTGPARTILDLAAVVSWTRLNIAVDSALRKRLVRWHDLAAVLARHSRRGRDGCGRLRALLEERYGEARPPDSAFNRMVLQLLHDAGFEVRAEHEIHDHRGVVARVDLALPASRIAIELDSRSFHDNELAFVADRRRSNRIVNLGWRLLAFTWDDYRDRPMEIVATVAASVRSWGSLDS